MFKKIYSCNYSQMCLRFNLGTVILISLLSVLAAAAPAVLLLISIINLKQK